jgi:hypothetical protein
MAEPQLEIEKRLDRHEKAIGTMAQWLVQAQTGFNANDAAGIEKILRGENDDGKQSSEHHSDSERQTEPGPEIPDSSDGAREEG